MLQLIEAFIDHGAPRESAPEVCGNCERRADVVAFLFDDEVEEYPHNWDEANEIAQEYDIFADHLCHRCRQGAEWLVIKMGGRVEDFTPPCPGGAE